MDAAPITVRFDAQSKPSIEVLTFFYRFTGHVCHGVTGDEHWSKAWPVFFISYCLPRRLRTTRWPELFINYCLPPQTADYALHTASHDGTGCTYRRFFSGVNRL